MDKIEIHKTSVLVHCSDGWDRTAQVLIIIQFLLSSEINEFQSLSVSQVFKNKNNEQTC